MTLPIDGHPLVPHVGSRICRPVGRPSASKVKRLNDPWAHQMEGQVVDLKRRIPILKRLIADCDGLAADLEQEVRNEDRSPRTEISVAGKRNFQGRDKEAETALNIHGRRCTDKISLGNSANSG